MVLSITSALALFVLITLSTAVFFTSKKLKVPYTVLLVLVGLLLVPIVNEPHLKNAFGFIGDIVLTPELLFFIFLPVLIFESGFNMSMRKMLDSAWIISLLAIVGLSVSVTCIAGMLYFAMPYIGIEMPFIVALLFGTIISPTDPVAVLSLFKECEAPRRLAMIFEGESLLNDGAAMALFMVVLGIATDGFHGTETVLHGFYEFSMMMVAGVVIGLVMAALFTKALKMTSTNEFVTVTLLIVSAHMVFIVSELINHAGIIHVSPIISTTVAALFLGNYSRNALKPKVDEYLGKLIEHMAFVINSLVFLMAGLLFASSGVDFMHLWLPITVAVFIVAIARVIAVVSVTRSIHLFKIEKPVPTSWEKLLAWSSLRGALSIIIVFLIPEDFMIDGWTYMHSPRDFLLALTIGCILATLFIKAPMIVPMMKRLGIDDNDALKEAYKADLGVYYLMTERHRLLTLQYKDFVSDDYFKELLSDVERKIKDTRDKRDVLLQENGIELFEQTLHLSAIHIEKRVARRLFTNKELSERVYRRIYSKLTLQQEMIERAQHKDIDPKAYTDRKDIFNRLVDFVMIPFSRGDVTNQQQMEYYRAQMIMARDAVQTLEKMQNSFDQPVFLEESYDEVMTLYKRYSNGSRVKLQRLIDAHADELSPYLKHLAERSLFLFGTGALNYLHDKGLVDEHTEHDIEATYAINGDFVYKN